MLTSINSTTKFKVKLIEHPDRIYLLSWAISKPKWGKANMGTLSENLDLVNGMKQEIDSSTFAQQISC